MGHLLVFEAQAPWSSIVSQKEKAVNSAVKIISPSTVISPPEFATYEMRNPKPGKGLGYFVA